NLFEQIQTSKLFWEKHIQEIKLRFEKDVALLSEFFNEGKPIGSITEISEDLSDLHNNGKAVAMISFSSGKKLIYKPRDVKIAAHFQTLLDLISQSSDLDLKSYKILAREGYGWEEVIEHRPPNGLFYKKCGAYLCLLYLLHASDIHKENIIASGEDPFFVDLEALFTPHWEKNQTSTVLNTGMLPFLIFAKGKGYDISALGREKEVSYKWVDLHSTAMRQELIEQKSWSAVDHVDQVLDGFESMYRWVLQFPHLLNEWKLEIPKSFTRVVLKPTEFYSALLDKLRAPHAWLHADQKMKDLGLLSKPFWGASSVHSAIAEAEKNSLLKG